MALAWTAPRTWVDGETLTAALLNTHLRDNLSYLLRPNQNIVRRVGAGASITGSPTTYAPVDAAFTFTFECAGGHLLVWASGMLAISASLGHTATLALVLDTTVVDMYYLPPTVSGLSGQFSFMHIFPNVSAGNHTVSLQWKISNAATTMILRHETPLILGVVEL